MNKWSCQHPGCRNEVVGCGGAIGLRAIGWYVVVPGPKIFCPAHRPDAAPPPLELLELFHPGHSITSPEPCSRCTATAEARKWQSIIEAGGLVVSSKLYPVATTKDPK